MLNSSFNTIYSKLRSINLLIADFLCDAQYSKERFESISECIGVKPNELCFRIVRNILKSEDQKNLNAIVSLALELYVINFLF